MTKGKKFKKEPKVNTINYDELKKLYVFFEKYQRNHPDFNASRVMKKLYPKIDLQFTDSKNNRK